jgi:hypothetical protein
MSHVIANDSFFVGNTLVQKGDAYAADDPIVEGREHLFHAPEVTLKTSRPDERAVERKALAEWVRAEDKYNEDVTAWLDAEKAAKALPIGRLSAETPTGGPQAPRERRRAGQPRQK